MSRPLFDSPYIFGIHEPGGEQYMLAAGRPGWILFSEVLGHDPADLSGGDYTSYAAQGLGGIFVEGVRGSFSNVVGLPLRETAQLLGLDGGGLPPETR